MLNASQMKTPLSRAEAAVKEALTQVRATNAVDIEIVRRLLPAAEAAIGPLATAESVMRVAEYNPDSVWLFSRSTGQPEGFQAFLLLNDEGRKLLLDGKLNLYAPPVTALVQQGETPSLIYVWATFTPGKLAAGINTKA